MAHKIIKCKECKEIIMQCRCPAKHKDIEWQICGDCEKKLKQAKI